MDTCVLGEILRPSQIRGEPLINNWQLTFTEQYHCGYPQLATCSTIKYSCWSASVARLHAQLEYFSAAVHDIFLLHLQTCGILWMWLEILASYTTYMYCGETAVFSDHIKAF